jgi:hypothetical protein
MLVNSYGLLILQPPLNINCCVSLSTGEWRKFHNEKRHNLYSFPNTITLIKSRRMRWARHVARMGRRGKCTGLDWKAQRKETTLKTEAWME